MLRLEDVHSYYGDEPRRAGREPLRRRAARRWRWWGATGRARPRCSRPSWASCRRGADGCGFDGTDITRLDTHEIARRGITLGARGPAHLPAAHGGREPASRHASGAAAPDGAALERVLEYFPRLRERLDQTGQNLSGGEQQMLALARGFLTRPDLMLIDELSGGLDADAGRRADGDPPADQPATASPSCSSSRTLEVALALASRCYVLDQGRIQFEGPADALRRDHEIQAAVPRAPPDEPLSPRRIR